MQATGFMRFCAAVLIGGLIPAGAVRGAIIYADNFDGQAGVDLHGLAPDTRTGAGGSSASATWAAQSSYDADGLVASASRGMALLPFTPLAGYVYTASADVNTTVGDWMAFGFAQNAPISSSFNEGDPNAYAWMLLRSIRGTGRGQRFLGPVTSGQGTNFDTPSGVANLKIVLDTTNTNWTAAWYINDALVSGPAAYTTNPTIGYVGFARTSGAGGTIDNFILDAVPEPATVSLFGLASLALLRRRQPHSL